MSFLSKKELSLIAMVNADKELSESDKKAKITEIQYLAQLRADRYRKPVKIFLHAFTTFKYDSLASGLMK